jgi:hypothetical protein
MSHGEEELSFEELQLPVSLRDAPRALENALRRYYVDGRQLEVPRDGVEPWYSYELRASFVLARSFNAGVRVDELIANSRVAANKRWTPIVRDDAGKLLRTPQYVDRVEEAYAEALALPSMDALAEERGEAQETLYYEPEVEGASDQLLAAAEPSAAPLPSAAAPGRRPAAQEPTKTKLVSQQDLPVASRASSEVTELSEHAWRLTARFPLHAGAVGASAPPLVRRLASLPALPGPDVDALLAPAYAAYSTELSSTLGNLGRATLEIVDGALVFVADFPTETLAEEAGIRVARMVGGVRPTELRTATGRQRVYYALPVTLTVQD